MDVRDAGRFHLAAMALEEFYRWGGLAASIIARIGLALPMLAGALAGRPVGLFGRLAGIMGAVTGVGAQLVGGLAKGEDDGGGSRSHPGLGSGLAACRRTWPPRRRTRP